MSATQNRTKFQKFIANPALHFSIQEAKANAQKLGQGDGKQVEFGLVDALLSMSHSAVSHHYHLVTISRKL